LDKTITVTGTAEVFAAPDLAVVSLGVESLAATAAGARTIVSENMRKLLDILREARVESRDIQTQHIELEPEYDYSSSTGRTLRGYVARNTVSVKLRDIASSGETIDRVLEVAGDSARLNGISFDFADPAALYDRARREAIAEAQRRAATYADAAGVAVGEVLEITERTDDRVPSMPYRARAMSSAAMPVEAGEESVRVDVMVRFALVAKP